MARYSLFVLKVPLNPKQTISVSMATFPGEPGLAGFILPRTMEVVVTPEAVNHAKVQSSCHHQQTNTQSLTGQVSFLSLNRVKSIEGKAISKSAPINPEWRHSGTS